MSILVVNDINIDNDESIVFFESIMNCLRILFIDDTFIREYSEYLFSIYNVLDDDKKEVMFKSSYFRELFWYPVSSSCLNFLSIYKKIIDYISNNKLPFIKKELDNENSKDGDTELNVSLKSVELCIKEILSNQVVLEHNLCESDRNQIKNTCNHILNANPKTNDYNDLVIGKERQLLVLWLMSFDNYNIRNKNGNFPKFKDIYESCIIPNVEIKYILLTKSESDKFETSKNSRDLFELEECLVDVSNINNNDGSIKLKEFIIQTLKTFFFSDKYTLSLSPTTTLSELDYFEDLSVIGFHLYPNLNAFPLFIQETFENLTIPPYSTIVGILSLEKYQPLPVVTRRLIEVKNSSPGKIKALKALILALYKDKLTIALELDSKWFALLNSITIGSNIHLALDILLPGYVIVEDN